jgi:hypothetical protein
VSPLEFLSQTVDKNATVALSDKGLLALNLPKGAGAGDLASRLSVAFFESLQPSGKQSLIEAFRGALGGGDTGLIGKAAAAGEAETLKTANETLLEFKGGWTKAEEGAFTKRLLARAESGVEDADPRFENMFRYFRDWAHAGLKDDALGGGEELLRVLKGIPSGGKPFNHSEAMLYDNVFQRMRRLEDETYRLQNFARDRTLFERSINHPFFGLYPASYMWFKIMPEMVRLLAKEPFGLRTGALAYAFADVQKDIAIQREFDPEFEAMLTKQDRNAFLWMLSYMLPATPDSIPASFPPWARDLAGQGLANEAAAKAGRPVKGLDLTSPLGKVGDYVSPIRSADQLNRAAASLGDTLFGTQKEQRATPGEAGLTAAVAAPAQELAAPLADAVDELTGILSSQ